MKKTNIHIVKKGVQKSYCSSCHEDPCMCSDPEQTSTVTDW